MQPCLHLFKPQKGGHPSDSSLRDVDLVTICQEQCCRDYTLGVSCYAGDHIKCMAGRLLCCTAQCGNVWQNALGAMDAIEGMISARILSVAHWHAMGGMRAETSTLDAGWCPGLSHRFESVIALVLFLAGKAAAHEYHLLHCPKLPETSSQQRTPVHVQNWVHKDIMVQP